MLAGVFPVLSTPFFPDGACDPDSLVKLIAYVSNSGAHGIVYPGIASEFATLNGVERQRMSDVVLKEGLARRLEVVIGISSDSTANSAELAQRAAHGGASALMLMAPRRADQDPGQIIDFFSESLKGVRDVPVILQNAPPPLGSALPIDIVLQVLAKLPCVRFVKEENVPCGQRVTQILSGAPDHLLGVIGGAGGRFSVDEYVRGACASMPSCELVEAHVALWQCVQNEDIESARRLLVQLLPLLNMGFVFRQSAVKYMLWRRGLLQSAFFRDTNPQLDKQDRAEMDWIFESLAPLMTATHGSKNAELA